MTKASIIPLSITIQRNATTGKKEYYNYPQTPENSHEPITKLPIPADWQTTEKFSNFNFSHDLKSYAVRLGGDIIVIDCDSQETTDLIDHSLTPYTDEYNSIDIEHYIVQSDKGFRHFYFTPTEYYKKSILFQDTRLAIDKIDLLHGRAFIFAECEENKTKYKLQGTPLDPIYYKIDYLNSTIARATDFKDLTNVEYDKIKNNCVSLALAEYVKGAKAKHNGEIPHIVKTRLVSNESNKSNKSNKSNDSSDNYIDLNYTRGEVLIGHYLTPIPDNIVDLLVDRYKNSLLLSNTTRSITDTDYKPLETYLFPIINSSLGLYQRTKNMTTGTQEEIDQKAYKCIENMFRLLTPSRYRHMVEPDYHPNRVPDGEGMNYLQALATKLSIDKSVDIDTQIEVLVLITQQLWENPLPPDRLESFCSYIRKQTFTATKKQIFRYEPNISVQPLVSINDNEYLPIYRTLDDQYILPKPSGNIEVVNGLPNFKKAVTSSNYSMLVDNDKVNLANNSAFLKITESIKTVQIRHLPYRPSGEFIEDGSLYYNTYVANKYLSIIRGDYLADVSYYGEGGHPTITKIIKNIMYDNLELYKSEHGLDELDYDPLEPFITNSKNGSKLDMYRKFILFLSHKLKTLDYSPIVFQMMGNRGIGKSLLMQILRYLTNSLVMVKLSNKNTFNSEQEGAIFLNEDENKVSQFLIDTLKELSGNTYRRIEGKYVKAYEAKNVSTYISTTNHTTPLAEVLDDRRFVTISGFKADRFPYTDSTDLDIVSELEQFSILLRDCMLVDFSLYIDANKWHDKIHFSNLEERTKFVDTVDKPSAIASLVYNLNQMTGEQICTELVGIFGEGFHYIKNKTNTCMSIALHKPPRLFRKDDMNPVSHNVTRDDLKQIGLDAYVKRNTNVNSNPYGVAYYTLDIVLAPDKMVEVEKAIASYSSI